MKLNKIFLYIPKKIILKICFLLFLICCFFLYCNFEVDAASLTSSELGYRVYTDGQSSSTWHDFSSSNLSQSFSGVNTRYLIAFNYKFTLSSYFQTNSYYEISYQLTNSYNEYTSNYTLKDNLEEKGSSAFLPGCYFTSSGSYQNSGSCFKSITTTITKINIGVVKITHSFIPKQNIYRIVFQNESEDYPLYTTSGWSTTNIQYSVTEDASAAATIENGKKIDKTNDILEDTKDFITDDSDPQVDEDEIYGFINGITIDDPLEYLLLLPLNLVNRLVVIFNSNSCSSVNLGSLLGSDIILPCIDLESLLGSTLWTTIDILSSIGICVMIVKNLYETISNILSLGGEKEIKEQMHLPTPMDFLTFVLGGDKS